MDVVLTHLKLILILCLLGLITKTTIAQQCNHIDDYTALFYLYHETDGDNWTNNTNWEVSLPPIAVNLDTVDFDSWYGITCLGDRVTSVKLNNNGLNGTLTHRINELDVLIDLWLDNNNLSGPLPSDVGALSNLSDLRLHFNQLSGEIPSSIGDLSNLTQLTLNGNDFSGSIPSSFGNLSNLTTLRLTGNQLTGSIPFSLGTLSELTTLSLDYNELSGAIPYGFGFLSKLTFLNLGGNNLSGTIPFSFGSLAILTYLDLSNNNLSSTIPNNISNLAQLERLYLGGNDLTGKVPYNIGDLSMLDYLDLSDNQLSGCYPSSLNNLCGIHSLDLTGNTNLPGNGDVQGTLCNDGAGECCQGGMDSIAPLPICYPQLNLTVSSNGVGLIFNSMLYDATDPAIDDCTSNMDLDIQIAIYRDGIPDSAFVTEPLMVNCDDICRQVNVLIKFTDLAGNSTICDIPVVVEDKSFPPACTDKSDYSTLVFLYKEFWQGPNWTNKSGWEEGAAGTNCDPCTWHGVTCDSSGRVSELNLRNNNISGFLPPLIGNLDKLEAFYLDGNNLTGNVPSHIGMLSHLRYLSFQNNQLSGELPMEIYNLSNLELLWVQNNQFSGIIPNQIEDLSNLEFLSLSGNNFTGSIPSELVNLNSLRSIDLSNNNFDGLILETLSGLPNLGTIVVSNNDFTGSIPAAFEELKDLTYLRLNQNNFSGNLPEYLGYLQNMVHLDISNNSFSGCIPYSYKTFCAISKSDGRVIKWNNNPGLDNGGNFNDFCIQEIGSCSLPTDCNIVKFRIILGSNSTQLLFHFKSMENSFHTNGFIVKSNPNGDTLDYILKLDSTWHALDLTNIEYGGLGTGSFEIRELSSNTLLLDNLPFDRHVLTQDFSICGAQEFNNTYNVTNTNDSGPGSLRAALISSQEQYGHDTIRVQTSGVISLDSSLTSFILLPFFEDVTLFGNGIIIDANNYGRLSQVSSSVTIHDVTFRNASSPYTAGVFVISNQSYGDSAIFNCVLFEDNTAQINNILGGGAIRIGRETVVKAVNSTFSGNQSMYDGGAIYVREGTLVLDQCTFTDNMVGSSTNKGGAIYNDQGKLYITNSIFANSLPSGVADIYNEPLVNIIDYKTQVKSGDTLSTIPVNDNNLVENCVGDCPIFDFSEDPMLGPLADNGGNTFTHALLPGSDAIDITSDNNPPPDGRGFVGSTIRDIGAYEFMGTYPDPCETYEFLIDTVMMQIVEFSASEVIGSQQLINSNSQVIYQAANHIELKKKFSILNGSTLDALIDDCLNE